MSTFEKIDELQSLPTLPANFSRLVAVLNNDQSTLRELEEIIRFDQSLAARIITVANSPAFGSVGYINSLEQAILLLGFDFIRNIALGVAVFQSFPLPPTLLKHLWAHAYSVGTVSNYLARKISHADRSVAFLGGLLHDIGRIVLLTIFPSNYTFTEDADTLIESEKERFQCSHAEAGHYFLKSLYVPDEVCDSVRYHHSIDMSNQNRDVLACVYLAEGIMQLVSTVYGSDSLWTDEHQNLFTAYGLGTTDINEIAAMVKSQESEIQAFFKL